MLKVKELFKDRLVAHLKLLNRYLRYIFNGHFLIAIIFLIVTLAVYYQQWLSNVSDSFPASFVIALFLSFAVLYNPLQFFLKRPDQVFLIVQEKALREYFFYGLIYNYVVQLYIVLIVIAGLGPLYFTFYPEASTLFNVMLIGLVLVVKAWHLAISWRSLQTKFHPFERVEKVFRILFTIIFFYSLLEREFFLVIGIGYILYLHAVYIFYLRDKRMHWERLIQNDEARLGKFYRFVSLFAEVPQLKSRLRKRRILTKLVEATIPFNKRATYDYLYRLTFLRSGDYFSLYLRLTILGMIVLIFVPNPIIKLALAILFLYMTSFQLQSLYYHHRTNVWLDLYPVEEEKKRKAFLTFTFRLSFVQVLLLSIALLLGEDWTLFFQLLGLGILFIVLFQQVYIKKKLR